MQYVIYIHKRQRHHIILFHIIFLWLPRVERIAQNLLPFLLLSLFCASGGFRGCPTQWNYPFSSIQPFLRGEAQLPPGSASVLVLRMLRLLRVPRVSVRCL